MVETFVQLLSDTPAQLAVLILAITPIIELRGALPVALAVYNLPLYQTFFIVLIGNMIPAFLILYGWDALVRWTEKSWPWLRRVMLRLENYTQGKWDKKIEKYGPIALIIFVAIPLPISGVWTGALAAWVFSLSKPRALWSIFAGVLLAAIFVSALTYGGLSLI